MNKLISAIAVVVVVVTTGCTAQQVCEKHKECSSDPPGEDYVNVCATRVQGEYDALRANKEPECSELATAKEALDACKAQLSCDDYEENDLGGECDDELDDYEDLVDDTADGEYGVSVANVGGSGPYITVMPKECSAQD